MKDEGKMVSEIYGLINCFLNVQLDKNFSVSSGQIASLANP